MTEFRPSRFEVLPIVIKNLLIINGLVFLAQMTFAKDLESYPGQGIMEAFLGLHHVKSPLFEPWQLLTHAFLHGGFLHLAMNMFGLWMFGSILENIWGPKRFLTFYLLCAIGGGLIQLASLWFEYRNILDLYLSLKNQASPENMTAFFRETGLTARPQISFMVDRYVLDHDVSSLQGLKQIAAQYTNLRISNPTIGASGAVFGILAAFIYLFPNTTVYLGFLFPIKAKWIGLFYFSSEIISALRNSPTDNVAHWAHLGGGLVGFLLVLTWNKKSRKHFY